MATTEKIIEDCKKSAFQVFSTGIEEQALTVKEAANFLKTKPQTLDRWRVTRSGPPFSRIGVGRGKILYRLSALIEWLKENEMKAA